MVSKNMKYDQGQLLLANPLDSVVAASEDKANFNFSEGNEEEKLYDSDNEN